MNQRVWPRYTKEIVAASFALVVAAASFIYFVARGIGLPELLVIVVAGLFVPAITLLYCYIYGDARRRNMNAPLWTVLAIFAPSGIGILLYFLLREPIAACCTKCGTTVQSGFAFCPHCGASMAEASCPQCHRIPQPGWSHCASCGAKL